jgi:hypothetical protein
MKLRTEPKTCEKKNKNPAKPSQVNTKIIQKYDIIEMRSRIEEPFDKKP